MYLPLKEELNQVLKQTLADGIKVCGLHPLNPNVLDCTKYLEVPASAHKTAEHREKTEKWADTTLNY
jgi:hypothetical protein